MSADKYDFIITHNGTDYEYMLRQKGDTKDFLVSDAPLTPQTLVTESASPTTLQPERQIQISQVDWRKGFQDFILEDEYKYYDSENCDARFKGLVTLSPKKLSSLSLGDPPAAELTDGGLEQWTDENTPTHWTETGDGVQRSSISHSGTYSAHGGGTNAGTIYQDISWDSSYAGKHFSVSAWARRDSATSTWVKIQINDGVGTSSTTITTAQNTWQQGTVTRKLSANATRLRIILSWQTSASHVYMDDVSIDYYPICGTVPKIVEFGSDIVGATGNQLFTIETSSVNFLYPFPEIITDLCVFKNRLYIAQGWGNAFYYTSDLSTFIESTLLGGITDNVSATTADYDDNDTSIIVVDGSVYGDPDFYARWEDEVIKVTDVTNNTLTVVRGQLGSTAASHSTATNIRELDDVTGAKYMANIGGSVFLIADSNNTLRSSDNPVNDGTPFSTQYQVGSDDWDITGLVDHEDTWFVRKEDNTYYLSGSDVFPLIPELASEASTTYTYGLYYWKGNLYIGSGVNSLYEYEISSGAVTTISPTRYAPGDPNYDGQVLAICGDETYLYVAQDNGSGIKILAGRWENVDGDTDWYWHPLYTLSSHNDITAMLISSLSGSKRLYTGTDTSSDGIIPYIVPIGYSQPYTESGYECQSSGTFITPWYVSNFPTETKYWKSVDFTSICCTNKTSITPYYQVKGGSWTAMDALTTKAYEGGYPAETTDSRDIEKESERIRFKFEMAASNDNYTPILYGKGGGGIVTYAVLQPTKKRQITATIQVASKIRLRDNTVENRTVSTDLSNLRTIYQAGGEITITAPDDTTYTCVFARDGYSEQLGYDEVIRTECWWCTLKLLEV